MQLEAWVRRSTPTCCMQTASSPPKRGLMRTVGDQLGESLLTIEPDSHLFATSSLIWIEKKIEDGRKTLAPLSPKKKVKTAQATHEENARFYHNFVTLLDSKRIVDAGDAAALKELVSTMHESSASNALHFKQVLYSSSKAWPAIVERLSSWLEFYLGSEGPVRHDEVGAAARGRAGSPLLGDLVRL